MNYTLGAYVIVTVVLWGYVGWVVWQMNREPRIANREPRTGGGGN